MKFKLEFDMDNAAFEHYPEYEMERILKEVKGQIGNRYDRIDIPIFDINGNRIGVWGIE